MITIFLLYSLPATVGSVGVYKLFFKRNADTLFGAITVFSAVCTYLLIQSLAGSPMEMMNEKREKDAAHSEIVNSCKLVETGLKAGVFSLDQDGYLCKDGIVHYIPSRN
ncbi:hypothetical protein AGJ33_19755 [Cronobacter dublinensis subsp. dublinensis]|nr:hypothetical protein [Cronobacter dublinensis subsp. dublinensis]